jgi:septation ring formation regulator EzrA
VERTLVSKIILAEKILTYRNRKMQEDRTMNHNVVLSLKILMSSEDFQGNLSITIQALKTIHEF